MGEAARKIVPNTPEWLKERMKYLGASDAPVCLGFSRWRSPVDVYLSKVEEQKLEETPAMHRGTVLEGVVAKAYANLLKVELEDSKFMVHPTLEWMAATPDRFVKGQKKLVQIKTSNLFMRDEWGEEGTNDIPEYHYIQVSHEMAVADCDEVDVVVLFADEETFAVLVYMLEHGVSEDLLATYVEQMDLRIYTVQRDLNFEADLIEAEKEFWFKYVVAKVVPPDLTKVKDSGEIRKATEEEEALIAEYKEQWLIHERSEKLLELKKARAKELIGEDKGIEGPEGKLSWGMNKPSTKTYVDWQTLAKTLGATPEQIKTVTNTVTKPGPRVFRVPHAKWKKEL
jgi:putative phage-type endonuclease